MPQPCLAEQAITWELVNPTGVVKREVIDPAPRISTLEGKTVALFWNGKNNGDVLLDRLAELLVQKVPGINVVKVYEKNPKTVSISGRDNISEEKSLFIQGLKPDLVIASQAD
jgi:hypothetical protein